MWVAKFKQNYLLYIRFSVVFVYHDFSSINLISVSQPGSTSIRKLLVVSFHYKFFNCFDRSTRVSFAVSSECIIRSSPTNYITEVIVYCFFFAFFSSLPNKSHESRLYLIHIAFGVDITPENVHRHGANNIKLFYVSKIQVYIYIYI